MSTSFNHASSALERIDTSTLITIVDDNHDTILFEPAFNTLVSSSVCGLCLAKTENLTHRPIRVSPPSTLNSLATSCSTRTQNSQWYILYMWVFICFAKLFHIFIMHVVSPSWPWHCRWFFPRVPHYPDFFQLKSQLAVVGYLETPIVHSLALELPGYEVPLFAAVVGSISSNDPTGTYYACRRRLWKPLFLFWICGGCRAGLALTLYFMVFITMYVCLVLLVSVLVLNYHRWMWLTPMSLKSKCTSQCTLLGTMSRSFLVLILQLTDQQSSRRRGSAPWPWRSTLLTPLWDTSSRAQAKRS